MGTLFGFDRPSTRDIAETTRRVLGSGAAVRLPAGRAVGTQRPLVVQLVDDIEPDEPQPAAAKVMALAGGAWVDTKQRVLVRNVGDSALDGGSRHIAHPVANLGLCVGN